MDTSKLFKKNIMIIANRHHTEHSNHDQSSSERVKCSYLTKYSNGNNDDHTAIPILIPATKPSIIHKDLLECSCCNIKISLEDTRFLTTDIKNPDLQKVYLKNATHLIGPNSCLCAGCYQEIKKLTSTKYSHTKRDCIIMDCEQTACHTFNSKLMDILKPTILIHKINFRVQTNEEEKLHKTSFCNAHYDQLLFITKCQLCGNQSLQKFEMHKDIVNEYQLILDENNISATIKYGMLICKPCHIYILLLRDKTTIIPFELEKHCNATKTRIINNIKLKTKELESIKLTKSEINMEKKQKDNQSLTVTSLPTNKRNIFPAYSSIPSKSVTTGLVLDNSIIPPPLVNSTSMVASMQSLTAVITATIETVLATEEAPLTTITKPIIETPITAAFTKVTEDVKLTVATEKSTVLKSKRKRKPKFLDEHLSVPRTKIRVVNQLPVTTDSIKHTMLEHKPTIPVHKPKSPGVKPTTSMQSLTATIETVLATEEAPLTTITKPIIETPITAAFTKVTEDVKLTVPTEKSTVLKSKQKRKPKFLDEHSSVPRTKIRVVNQLPVTTDSIKHTMLEHKPTIPVHKPKSPGVKPTTPVNKPTIPIHKPSVQVVKTTTLVNEPTTQVDKHTTPDHKPTIPVHKSLYNKSLVFSPVLKPIFSSKWPEPNKQLFENLKVPVDKLTIADDKPVHKKSIIFSPVLRPYFSSKCCIPKKQKKTLESISPIIEPTKLQMNQPHPNSLDSQSTSQQTEFPELKLHRGEPSTLSSSTSDMNQLFDILKVPLDKPMIPINEPTIADHKPLDNKSPVAPPILVPVFGSKCTELKKYVNLLEPVSPIIEPTKLQTNQSHPNSLDSQSTSQQTEFPELKLHRGEPSTLSSSTSDMNQLFDNLKVPLDKPIIPIKEPTIADHKPLGNKSPVASKVFSSKCTELNKYDNPLETVSPIIEATQLQTNQLHPSSLDSRSTSQQTEFPELKLYRGEPSTLSSSTSDMNQLFDNLKVPLDKPIIPIKEPTIADHKPLGNKSPVASKVFSSKCTELKKYDNPLETVSPIIEATQLPTNQLHPNSLDSRSTSQQTEFPELKLHRGEPSTLSSSTSDMNQLFDNLKVPLDKPIIPIKEPTIADHKPLGNKSPVASKVFSSKCTKLKKYVNPLETVSPIIEATQLQTNQLHPNSLDSRSTSQQTEFPELKLHRGEPSTLSSSTSDMNQLFDNLKIPLDKPIIPIKDSTIADHKPLGNKSPVASKVFSSKCTELKKYDNPLETVSPIIEATQLQTNQLHPNSLDSRSTSQQTEFPELKLHRGEPSTLSSSTSDMNQLFDNLKVPLDKPIIPIKEPTIADHKPLGNKSPVASKVFSSKCTKLKKYVNPLETVSPIIEATQLQTNQLHPNSLDSRSTSQQTEFPELKLHRGEPSTLSSSTSDMNQLFDNLKVPLDKPIIPIKEPTIADHKPLGNKSPVAPPILVPVFGSKCTELKKYVNLLEPVSPIIEPTKLQTNQSHPNSLDSQSTSQQTEFPELKLHRAEPSTLSSSTSDMNQLFDNIKVPLGKPMIPINEPTIADHKPLDNKLPVAPPVLIPVFSSKCTELKKYVNPLETVSPIIEPTQLQTNQSHPKSLDLLSTSQQTEFSELKLYRAEPSTLSSSTSDMNQLFDILKVPLDKPMIPINKPTIADHKALDNKTPVASPILIPVSSSKCTELKEDVNLLEPVSPIIEPTRLQKNQSHPNSLDSQSTSQQTEFPELKLHRGEPSKLASSKSNMDQLFENLKVLLDKSTIANHKRLYNKSPVFPPVLSPFLSSKYTVLKKMKKPPKSVSPIQKPTQLQRNQSHKNTLDSQSTSPRTEFPELSHQRAGPTILPSAKPDLIKLFENLKKPYPSGMAFFNHLLNLETCRNLGNLAVRKNKTIIYRQIRSEAETTPPHSIHFLPEQKEYQTVSRTNDDDNDLKNCDYLSDKCVPSVDNSSDSHNISVEKTSISCNIPKQKSSLPKSFVNKPSQYHDNGDSKKQVIDLQENSAVTNYPDITIAATTSTTIMSITTTEASTNIVSAASPIFTAMAKPITASEVPATVEMASVATNTSALITAIDDSTTFIADSTKATKNTVPAITNIVTINYDKSKNPSTVNENATVTDAAAVEESATLFCNTTALTMITNMASTTTNAVVSAAIDADSVTAATTTVTDDTTSVKINTESSTITNAITAKSPTSPTCADSFTTINPSTITSDITTTTETIFDNTINASKISNDSELTSNKNTITTIPPIHCVSIKGAMLKISNSDNKKFVSENSIKTISDSSNISTPMLSEIVKASTAEELSLLSRKLRQKCAIYKTDDALRLINLEQLKTEKFKSPKAEVWKLSSSNNRSGIK